MLAPFRMYLPVATLAHIEEIGGMILVKSIYVVTTVCLALVLKVMDLGGPSLVAHLAQTAELPRVARPGA